MIRLNKLGKVGAWATAAICSIGNVSANSCGTTYATNYNISRCDVVGACTSWLHSVNVYCDFTVNDTRCLTGTVPTVNALTHGQATTCVLGACFSWSYQSVLSTNFVTRTDYCGVSSP